jgi:hypothetical protein
MIRAGVVGIAVCASTLLPLAVGTATADPVQWAANGHWDEVITSLSLTREDARDAAQGMTWMATPGHLQR